ncbi:MAG: phosphoenolpyruvate mutase [Candidatus Scalindua sp.]
MTKLKKIRNLFASHKLIRVMGAHNALSAKLVEKAGFDAVWASGLEISTSYALPDANILSMTDFFNVASSMNEAVNIPVIADCDTGYGNSNNVIHLVKKYEAAEIAAVCIEDKLFPKVNSFIPGRQELASIAEFVGKILAAKNAQNDPDFFVIARVEALIAGWGMEEALKRAHAYIDAGADAILIHSKSQTPDEILEFVDKWNNRAPLVVVPTKYYKVTAKELQEKQISMVIYANHGIRASIRAMSEVFSSVYSSGSTAAVEDKIVTLEEVFELQGMPQMKESELKYSLADSANAVAVIPVAGDHLQEHSMKNISEDIPFSMLDINGKPLLQRQVEVLNKCKIYSINVVVGYKKEEVGVSGVKLIHNPDYSNTGTLYSIMCALNDISEKTIICYGDVIFDHVILSRIMESNEDITILIDNSYDPKHTHDNRRKELVIVEGTTLKTKRSLHSNELRRIEKIGADLNPAKCQSEFPGIVLLSKKGVEVVKDIYRTSLGKYSGKHFYSVDKFENALFSDLLQEIINSDFHVYGMEANSGWLEIHSFEDYKLACSILK